MNYLPNCAAVLLLFLLLSGCNHYNLFGGNSLGGNFSFLEGDKTTAGAIIYCTGTSWEGCYAGIPVIPSRKNAAMGYYVEDFQYNDDWIVAKSYDKQQLVSYWIINKKNLTVNLKSCEKIDCDSTIQLQVMGPYNTTDFHANLRKRGIALRL